MGVEIFPPVDQSGLYVATTGNQTVSGTKTFETLVGDPPGDSPSLVLRRGTDTSPTAKILDIQSAAGASLAYFDSGANLVITANLTVSPGSMAFGNNLGDRLMLYGAAGVSTSYGFGIESNNLYFKSSSSYRWYINTNATGTDGGSEMFLTASGLTVNGILTASGGLVASTGGLTVSAGGGSIAGGLTVTGAATTTAATTTGYASLNLPSGTAPTTPATGDMWATTAGLFFSAGAASNPRRIPGSTVVVCTTNTAAASTGTYVAPTGFSSVPVKNGRTYRFKVAGFYSCAAATYAIRCRLSYPTLTRGACNNLHHTNSTAVSLSGGTNALSASPQTIAFATPAVTSALPFYLEGFITPSADGNFTFDFTPNAAGTSNILAGTFMTVDEVG